jgi:hypothetical protein
LPKDTSGAGSRIVSTFFRVSMEVTAWFVSCEKDLTIKQKINKIKKGRISIILNLFLFIVIKTSPLSPPSKGGDD